MRNTGLLALILFAAFAAGTSAAESGSGRSGGSSTYILFDAHASALAPLTWSTGRPPLAQAAWDIGIGTEIRYGTLVPCRADVSAFSTLYSIVDSSGRLFRGLNGTRLALSIGVIVPFGRDTLGLLVGGALSAAQYQGTALLIGYPSAIAEVRYEAHSRSLFGFRASVPLELMFRGGTMTFSPGLRVGISVGKSGRSPR